MKKQILTLMIVITALTMSPAFAMETDMNDEDTYALAAGAKGAPRLTIQNETLKEGTEKHLSAVAPSSLIKKGIQKDALAKSLSGNSSAITVKPAVSNSSLRLGNQLSWGEPPPLPGMKITFLFMGNTLR